MSSLFAKYKLEREERYVIETEDVLAIYSFDNNLSAIYLEDIYVVPEKRHTGLAQSTADQVSAIGRERGLKYIVGSVCPNANGADHSLKILLKYGFKLKSSHENIIFFIKDL